jgi:dihydropteroate synthase
MGVVNVTPDSFSDGGQWFSETVAVAHGRHLLSQGADLLDVGGESTRPGASRVPEADERARVLPVISELVATGARVSVDTMRAGVAAAALDVGAWAVNDVSGGLADPEMLGLVAERDCHYVVTHWRGHSARMADLARYDDVVSDVVAELRTQLDAALGAGISPQRLIVDPGLGFAKDAEANWRLLAALGTLAELGQPVLVGASRKRFLGDLLARDGVPALPTFRDRATAAVSAIAASGGAWGVRVHDVAGSVDAVRVADAIRRAGEQGGHA